MLHSLNGLDIRPKRNGTRASRVLFSRQASVDKTKVDRCHERLYDYSSIMIHVIQFRH